MSGMRKGTKEKYEEIYRLYLAGKSKKEISLESHCAYSTIDRALREHGATLSRGTFEEKKEEILEMYGSGMTYQEIAEETGLNQSTISRHLRYMERGRASKRKKRQAEIHRETAEPPEEELEPKQYAKDWRQEREIVVNGKKYVDITDWFI